MQPMYSRQQIFFFYMKLATKGNLRFGFVFCFSVCIKKHRNTGGEGKEEHENVRIGREK